MRQKFRLGMAISVFAVIATLACVYLWAPQMQVKDVPFLGPGQICDPEIAAQYGVRGYVEIIYPLVSPDLLSVDRGGEINIDILLRFVSYAPELTEARVSIDPKSPFGGTYGKYCSNNGTEIIFNDFISYNASGSITIKAGETMALTMSMRIPEDLPKCISAIPVAAIGFWADVPMTVDLESACGMEVAIRG
jgi:hypothetical protein